MFKVQVLILLFSGVFAQASDVFEHELKAYPSNSRRCEAIAEELAQAFSQAAGVEIYFAGGTKTSDTECDVKIAYISQERLALPATIDRNSFSSVIWRGVYSKFEDCEKSLAFEKELFIREVGLSPWISFCATETSVVGKNTYYPVIEAIGNSQKLFFGAETLLGTTPTIGWEKALQEIQEGIQARGITAPSVHVIATGPGAEVRIRFYSSARLWATTEKFGNFTEPASCATQVDRIKSGLSKAQIAPIGVLCSKYFEGYVLDVINLTPDIIKSRPISERIDPKTYNTLGECLERVADTEKLYSEKFNKKVVGGFCFNTSPKVFQVMILEDSFRP